MPLAFGSTGSTPKCTFSDSLMQPHGQRTDRTARSHKMGQDELWDACLFCDSKTDTCLPTLPVTRDTMTLNLWLSHAQILTTKDYYSKLTYKQFKSL